MTYLREQMDDIAPEKDKQEQYSGRNCLLIQGIPENKNENTDVLAMEVIATKMDKRITANDIDKMTESGNQKTTVSRDQSLSSLFGILTGKRFFLVKSW